MTNRNKAKGTAFEMALVYGLRDHGFDVERLTLGGTQDQGDLRILDGHHIVVEAKDRAKLDLPQYLRELGAEKANYARARKLNEKDVDGIVICKRRQTNWKQAYVITTVEDYFGLEDK